MKDHQEIDCPCCGSKIYIQPQLLIRGSSFSCSNSKCDATVALSHSSYSVANNALFEFEKLRQTQL